MANRVGHVLVVLLDFMATIVSHIVDIAKLDIVTEKMGHVVHVQLDIMAVNVMKRVQTVLMVPVFSAVASAQMDVSMDSISLTVVRSVQMGV